MKIIVTIAMTFLCLSTILAQNNNRGEIYILIKKVDYENGYLDKKIASDSSRFSFSIQKQKFMKGTSYEKYLRKNQDEYIPLESSNYSFFGMNKPEKIYLKEISREKIYTVKEISIDTISFSGNSIFYFLERKGCKQFLSYKTFMQVYE